MVLAGWFYIIRRHITVETPLDKRNLERRDRIFVRTTRVKNHPEPPADYFSSFLRLFLRLEARSEPRSSLCLSHTHTFLFLHVSAKWPNENENSATRRKESKIREKSFFFFDIFFQKKKIIFSNEKKSFSNERERSFVTVEMDISICYRGGPTSAKLISKARRWDPTQQKALHVSPSPTTGSFKANCPQRGCKLPLSADVYAHALSSNPELLRAC